MSSEFDYSQDIEFNKLLAWRSDVDLTILALELARDAYPQLDFGVVVNWIRQRADDLRPVITRASSEREALQLVAKSIASDQGIVGDLRAYEESDGSFLNCVIEKQRGIPLSLTMLHMAVCRELNIDLQGVAAPRHFLSRVETPDGPLFLDAFAGCRIMNREEVLSWLTELTRLPKREISRHLKPVTARPIITRMLNNLKVLYAQREDWESAWKVQSRLAALSPSDYPERRDLALVAMRAEKTGLAIRLLNTLLRICPEEDRIGLEQHLEIAHREVHRWN